MELLSIDVNYLMDGLVIGILIVILILSMIANAFFGSWAWDLRRKNKSMIQSLRNHQPYIDVATQEAVRLSIELEESIKELESKEAINKLLVEEILRLQAKISRKYQPRKKNGEFDFIYKK